MIYATSFSEGLKPDPQLKVSEWANEYRVLAPTAASEPGKWRTERTPYLKEIMITIFTSGENSIHERSADWGNRSRK
ncbi:Phage terminase large subunit (GpA) [Armadillidium vulgare]|nr:Phage terminase large subunit (GpA) [Armadillidium vulgare] [Wolbachia endosymbiont of Armadillidium vulgare]